ncbi:TetR family transcriptional regulator [Actinomadura sp. CNU-125]|uniref:TetR/AcrR family transcriptional regulator n=1 Tax=Actinomadura sp. CNU-125 TaxID=1904961 RepID=UPI0009699F45|nr:TetR/AcrR family transcriptional regulator [Actinomadura sp. CNU-125]OLT38433.1 TetR family transcriptional regulator [Actinomadura sp. CNU-125]
MSPRKAAALRQGDVSLREHLIATADRMMSDRGAAGLTVRAIAREAGVADGVLYNHFDGKEELLALALRARVRRVEDGLGPLPEPGAGTLEANLRAHVERGLALHSALLPALAGLTAQPDVLARFGASHEPGDEWRDHLHAYLRAERDLGRIAADASVRAAASMIVGVCHEAVLSALLHAAEPAPVPVAEVVASVLHGIAPGDR